MPNKWLYFVIGLLALMWVFSSFMATEIFAMTTILWAVFVLALVHKFKIVKVLPINDKQSTWVLVLVGAFLFISGGFAFISPMLAPAALFGGAVAPVQPTPGTVTVPTVPATGCAAGAPNHGYDASVALNGWDLESNTPYSSTVNIGTDCWAYRNSGDASDYIDASADTSGTFEASWVSVGDTLNVWCGGTTYYTDPATICIDKESKVVNLNVHTIDAQTDIQVTGYDDTATTELTAGTTSTEEDYKITMGADEETDFYVKWKVNSANAAFQFGGIASLITNDVDEVNIEDSGYTKIATPNFLDNIGVANATGSTSSNVTGGYDFVWRKNTPVLYHEWESTKVHFSVKSTSTDPATDLVFASSDMVILCALDAQWAKGTDGKMYLDVYQHDSDEADVGMTEDYRYPVGKQTCTVIELV